MKWSRKLAIQLLDEVEELLEEHGIKIADSDREGDEDEACLYGSTYYALEDKFTELIERRAKNGSNEKKKASS